MFCIYVDELSKMLNNVHVGCFVGTILVNHLMYADDLVLLSPSAAGLSILPGTVDMLNILSILLYIFEHVVAWVFTGGVYEIIYCTSD